MQIRRAVATAQYANPPRLTRRRGTRIRPRRAVNLPNHDQLHHYWTQDPEGLAQWADHPHPYAALYQEILKHVPEPAKAHAIAAAWYHDVFHHWPAEGHADKKKRATQVAWQLASRAAEVATGAMVALVPSAADLDRLAVDGGEPTDHLHLTLAYLGKAADWPAEARAAVIDAVWALAEGKPPIEANGFAISAFNPTGDEPCIVVGVGGDELNWVHDAVAEAIGSVAESAGTSLPDQHSPWVPHVSLLYSDDFNRIKDLVDRAGPLSFDAIRVAFAGDNTDVPLTGADGDRADWTPELHPRDPANGKFTDHPGGGFAHKMAQALNGQAALDATPAKLRRAPGGHHGDYAGEGIDGPPGMGKVRALSEYEGPEYQTTNTFLRGRYKDPNTGEPAIGNESYLHGVPERIAEIDKTMAVSRLQEDVRVDRAIRYGKDLFGDEAFYGPELMAAEQAGNFDLADQLMERWAAGERPDLTGARWTDLGYQSTTADPNVAPDFGRRWVGTHYPSEGEPFILRIFVPKGTGGVQLAEMGHAAEILLERGLTMEVIADHGVTEDGFRHLDIEVVHSVHI